MPYLLIPATFMPLKKTDDNIYKTKRPVYIDIVIGFY